MKSEKEKENGTAFLFSWKYWPAEKNKEGPGTRKLSWEGLHSLRDPILVSFLESWPGSLETTNRPDLTCHTCDPPSVSITQSLKEGIF